MPALDVSFMLDDPMFSDDFTVTRRTDTVGANGRTVIVGSLIPDLSGVITQQDPADLMRGDDGQVMPRVIFVASKFRFRGPAPGYQPDVINWDGGQYVVKHVLPYCRFGEGFVEVIAESMTIIDPAPN